MAPIRLGDGTVVNPKGIAEVRKGDGTVLYSSGPDIAFDGYSTSFESGIDSGWVGNTVNFNQSSSESQDGSNSVHFDEDGNAIMTQSNSTAAPGSVYQCWHRWGSPAEGHGSVIGETSGLDGYGPAYNFMYTGSTGPIIGETDYSGSTNVISTGSSTLSSNTWYLFEVTVNSMTSFDFDIYEGATNPTHIETLSGSGSVTFEPMAVGISSHSNIVDAYWDNINLYQP